MTPHPDARCAGQKHIEPAANGDADGTGEILLVEPTGAETQVFFRAGLHEVVGAFREWPIRAPGEALPFRVHRHRIHLFDRESGQRLG